jgi:hypothetical protein
MGEVIKVRFVIHEHEAERAGLHYIFDLKNQKNQPLFIHLF